MGTIKDGVNEWIGYRDKEKYTAVGGFVFTEIGDVLELALENMGLKHSKKHNDFIALWRSKIGKYCKYMIHKGLLKSCEKPASRPLPPPTTIKKPVKNGSWI